ncbi:MAG: amidohydrolase, partial [Bacteroidota bacterium]
MKYIKPSLLLVVAVFALTATSLSAQVIGRATKGSFLLKNATIETITKGSVQGDLLIQDGKIANIGQNLSASGAKEIDCTGKFVYPGFIDSGTNLGLNEVSSISLTQDAREGGEVKPFLDALTAVNPSSVAIPVTRVGGVTTVLTMPEGGLIPGKAALINLVGYSPDEMHTGFKAMRMNFPSSAARGRRDSRSPEERKKAEEKKFKEITKLWEETRFFTKIRAAKADDPSIVQEYNPTLEAMAPVVAGELPL